MASIQRNLIFLTVLLILPPAHAENVVSDMPPVFIVPGQSDSVQADDAHFSPGTSLDNRGSNEPLLPGHGRERRGTAERRALESGGGLHWSIDGQRPTLAYRFSEDGELRFRGKSRGIEISARWAF